MSQEVIVQPGTTGIEGFNQLYDQRQQLIEQRESASDEIADLYDSAIETADQQLQELAATDEVMSRYHQLRQNIGQATLRSMQELNNLERLASGLLENEVIESRRQLLEERLVSDPEYQEMRRIGQFLGSLATTEQVQTGETIQSGHEGQSKSKTTKHQPESSPQDKETVGETDDIPAETGETLKKPEVTIKIRLDGDIQIGKRQIKLSNAKPGQKDYSQERLTVLKTLIAHQGQELPVNELWQKSFGDRPFNKTDMSYVRSWLNQYITYHKQPIVTHSGKRGTTSTYSIKHFDVKLVDHAAVEPEESMVGNKISRTEEVYRLSEGAELRGRMAVVAKALAESSGRGELLTSHQLQQLLFGSTGGTNTSRLTSIMSRLRRELPQAGLELEKSVDEDDSTGMASWRIKELTPNKETEDQAVLGTERREAEQPKSIKDITLLAASSLAACLEKRAPYLAAMGVEQLPPNNLSQVFLDFETDTQNESLATPKTPTEVNGMRQEVLEILAYIEANDSALEEALDVLPAESPILGLIEYIVDCRGQIDLLKAVISGQEVAPHSIHKLGGRYEPRAETHYLLLVDGTVVQPASIAADSEQESPTSSSDSVSESTTVGPPEAQSQDGPDKPDSLTDEQTPTKDRPATKAKKRRKDRQIANEKKQEIEAKLKADITTAVEEIHRAGLLFGSNGIRRIQTLYSFVTVPFFKSAQENGEVSARKSDPIPATDIVKLKLIHDYREQLNNKKLKRLMENLTPEIVGEYQERYSGKPST